MLERLAAELGLGAACTLTGHCDDVTRMHHAFDLLVQSSDYEGTPNAVLEAMALETPTVATDCGGTRELMEHAVHGWIVRPGDPETLAASIEEALADPAEARRRALAARRRVERHLSFDARMRRLESIYEELMERGHGTPVPVRT